MKLSTIPQTAGQVPKKGPKSSMQEDKATTPVHQLCLYKHLGTQPELRVSSPRHPVLGREVKTDEHDNKKNVCCFQASAH